MLCRKVPFIPGTLLYFGMILLPATEETFQYTTRLSGLILTHHNGMLSRIHHKESSLLLLMSEQILYFLRIRFSIIEYGLKIK